MTREKFIKKWLGNKDFPYTEENRNLMRDDLDKVINNSSINFFNDESDDESEEQFYCDEFYKVGYMCDTGQCSKCKKM
jgi:hypothetical protein